MSIPGAGKSDIPNRLKRQFACFHVPPPSEAAINDIFGSLMAGRFDAATFTPEVGGRVNSCRNGAGGGHMEGLAGKRPVSGSDSVR
jgi:hypothetical protein